MPYFQGPPDCVALILAVAGADKRWQAFSTDAFKPPSNPENWKFEQAGNPALELEGDDAPPRLEELLRALGEEG